MSMLEIIDFGKRFTIHHLGKTMQPVEHIDFSLEAGGFIGSIGKSGSGKSTVLKSLYRTYLPDQGRLLYDSKRFGVIDITKATEREMLYLRKYEIVYDSEVLHVIARLTSSHLVEQALVD